LYRLLVFSKKISFWEIEMKRILVFLLLVNALFACKKSCDPLPYTTYIAGFIKDSNNNQIPVYWKNRVMYKLPTPSGGEANSVFLSGDDVYFGGYVTEGKNEMPAIWKNDVLTVLTDTFGYVTNVKVANGEVYASGFFNGFFPVYWKNGMLHILSTHTGEATNVSVKGNDIYVCGYDDVFGDPPMSVVYHAAIWKNDSLLQLSDYNGRVLCIETVGSDYYATGLFMNNTGGLVAIAIKNGIVTRLSSSESRGYHLLVDQNDVYITGTEYDSLSLPIPYLQVWKNNIPTLYSQKRIAAIPSASVKRNSDFLIVGNDYNENKPALWINGLKILLSNNQGNATAIALC
jgi:hypothetical protein